ncbi:pentapeptide repeat-containing protein [Streptomyces sp. NBC_00083]|uniref:pentapeptide repeat-containing protein n=1 Tax=Streptomyces sp. NBC_00083 TaxID=2975647 RepID=UPI0022505365|nr:pentapeptide repeat-containing protein [Streptomyces sp. NBC_00083]MCX5385666.1 pentapeptide repeat-containing protein [Streptomyces sp. NBC_00083]
MSGIRDEGGQRIVRALPKDAEAVAALREWAGRPDSLLGVDGLDLTAADLSGADLGSGMLTGTVLRDAVLVGTDLYRCHLEGAVLDGADLTEAGLVKAVLDEASLRGAKLDGANLGSAELSDTDARGASLRGARLDGAALLGTLLQGADLGGASVRETSFSVVVDEHTVVEGLSGTVFGPMTVESAGQRGEVRGRELELWLNGRGADVRVIDPAAPPVTYYAKIGDGYPRSSPRGIVRRRFLDGVAYDEAFTRNLRWEPTEYLRLYELGHNEIDHVEITEAEADAFVAAVTAKLRERP